MQQSLFLILSLFLLLSHLFGRSLESFKQPRVISEILVGLALGPSLLGHFFPLEFSVFFNESNSQSLIAFKDLGLILLMYCSGTELKGFDIRRFGRSTFYTNFFGIGIPALFFVFALDRTDFTALFGAHPSRQKLVLVLALSAAVTSIPVISRIFLEVGLLGTNFSKMILSSAILEDVFLYATLNATLTIQNHSSDIWQSILIHILASSFFIFLVIFGKNFIYASARRIAFRKPNLELYQYVTLIFATLLLCVFILGQFGIGSMIGAFACGIISASPDSNKAKETGETIRRFSFATFIPIYFIMVGFKIDLSRDFSFKLLAAFLLVSSALKISGGYIAGICSGFSKFKSLITGITLNARGGPGIVIATTALDAGIINTELFSTLVLTALITSSWAGVILKIYRNEISNF